MEVAEHYADGLVGYAPYTADYVAFQAILTPVGQVCRLEAKWLNGMIWQAVMAAREDDVKLKYDQ